MKKSWHRVKVHQLFFHILVQIKLLPDYLAATTAITKRVTISTAAKEQKNPNPATAIITATAV